MEMPTDILTLTKYHWILYNTAHTAPTAKAIMLKVVGPADRAPPLEIVKMRTAENVSVRRDQGTTD